MFYLLFCVCLLDQGTPVYASENYSSHLGEYSSYNITYHYSIDDEVHAHKYKHIEDGEEDEQRHENRKIAQSEIKILNCSVKMASPLGEFKRSIYFYEKTFISSPYPFENFMSPIVQSLIIKLNFFRRKNV